ncbi:MAG: metallophosphoesterase [Thermoleophilia bacterium]|nr:metallophosphoesterase [Thermoleophilia bacterium]
MGLFGKKGKGKVTKLFFVTDVHGSETTFRKFVNSGAFYGVDVLVLGGDIAGKMVVPILDLGSGRYRATIQSITHELQGDDEVAAFVKRAGKLGTYTTVVTVDEYDALEADAARVDTLYHELATERMARWIEFAEERLAGSGIRCYITGGNDDAPDILEPLTTHEGENVVACEGKAVTIDDDGHLMLSTGLSNPTPWATPREVPDEDLAATIEEIVAGHDDFSRAIFNFHAPPKDSTLDTAAELDWSTDPPKVVTSGGTPVMYGAGSAAVRAAIEKHQPLLSLHGHIHESRGQTTIGRTVAVNPGSEYGEGLLRGALVTLAGDRVENVQLTSG